MSSCKYCAYSSQCTKSFCMQKFKKSQLFDLALLTEVQRKHVGLHPDADGTDTAEFKFLKTVENDITNFVKEGKNLYIHSTGTGCGKTAWALRMIQTYIDKIWYDSSIRCRALFISIPKLFLELKSNITSASEYVDKVLTNIPEADIIVWDEIGTKMLSDFEHEHLLSLINSRLDAGKANIFTSNLNPEELKEKIGDRLYSRIVNNSTDIEFHGIDKRGLV